MDKPQNPPSPPPSIPVAQAEAIVSEKQRDAFAACQAAVRACMVQHSTDVVQAADRIRQLQAQVTDLSSRLQRAEDIVREAAREVKDNLAAATWDEAAAESLKWLLRQIADLEITADEANDWESVGRKTHVFLVRVGERFDLSSFPSAGLAPMTDIV